MTNAFFSQNSLFPPQPCTFVPYVCKNCGEHFSKKKGILPLFVKCPKCKSSACISLVKF